MSLKNSRMMDSPIEIEKSLSARAARSAIDNVNSNWLLNYIPYYSGSL